jgi:hypothetical protein
MGWRKQEPRVETPVERLARETGWLILDREGDLYRLQADDCSWRHIIAIRYRRDAINVTFTGQLPCRFPLAMVTPEMTMGLLVRNDRLYWAKWGIVIAYSCEAVPRLHGSLQREGLTAECFEAMCRSMVVEMEAVTAELQGQAARLGGGGMAGRVQGPPVGGGRPMLPPKRDVWVLE